MPLPAGCRLGVYEIVAPLGAGGMGEVYRARDPRLRREVAIKVLPAAVSGDAGRRARFEREAHAVASLSHPNILAIHDIGDDGGVTYAVMELLEGRTLREVVGGGPRPPREAVDVARQIARGLEAAHARGLVHRDVKPENVMVLPDGHVKVLDFGLVAERVGDLLTGAPTETVEFATRPGVLLGTPGYMAPEQIRGEAADHRSDIFALGCVLYELLGGRRAFKGESAVDTLHATLRLEPRDLSTLAAVPAPLAQVVSRCLEKTRETRFQSAREVVAALDALEAPASRRFPWPRAIAAAALIVAGLGWAVWRSRAPGAPPAAAPEAVPDVRGIAVLPFETIGPAEQAYFAAGLTEEVTLQLAKAHSLRVISRAAVARFERGAAELPAMTRELRIGAVLTGSVRHAGDAVRIGVQLVGAPGGETLWSSEYDSDIRNIFAVQSDVAVRVAQSLRASLAPEERARIERPPTSVPGAYELYLKARDLGENVRESREAIALLERAIGLDPRFALAHAALSQRYRFLGYYTGREDLLRAVEAGRTAVTLDPQLARAHFALANALGGVGDIEGARLGMLRATELDSSLRAAMNDLSVIEWNVGRFDQAFYWSVRALPLAPNLAVSYYHVVGPLLALDAAAAERYLLAAETRFPATDGAGEQRVQILLAMLDLGRGRSVAALERMRAAVAAQPDNDEGQATLTEMAVFGGAADAQARVDRALAEGPDARGSWVLPSTPRTWRAHLWLQAGQPARARPLIDAALAANRKAMDQGDRSLGPPYENAALLLMQGDRAAGLDWLDRAFAAGLRDAAILQHDPMLAAVRTDPRFVQLLERMRAEVQEMRARVDLGDLDRWMDRVGPQQREKSRR